MMRLRLRVLTLIGSAIIIFVPSLLLAQDVIKPALKPPFGSFESGIFQGSIDQQARQSGSLIKFIDLVIKIVRGVVIAMGLLAVVIGGYRYMTAGGDSSKVATAKTIILSGLGGILLAILGQIFLNAISPQFFSDLQEPKLTPPKFPQQQGAGQQPAPQSGQQPSTGGGPNAGSTGKPKR